MTKDLPERKKRDKDWRLLMPMKVSGVNHTSPKRKPERKFKLLILREICSKHLPASTSGRILQGIERSSQKKRRFCSIACKFWRNSSLMQLGKATVRKIPMISRACSRRTTVFQKESRCLSRRNLSSLI